MTAKKISIRAALVIRMAAVLLAALIVTGIYIYNQTTSEATNQADRVVRQTSGLLDQSISTLLSKHESNAKFLAANSLPTFTTSPNKTLTSKEFPVLASQAFYMLQNHNEVSSVSYILNQTGEYLQVSRKGSLTPSIETAELIANGKKVRKTFFPYADSLLETTQQTGWTVDPRQQDFYKESLKRDKTVWTSVRPLSIEPNSIDNSTGVICVSPIFDINGNIQGVVTIGISLESLNNFLLNLKVGQNGFAFLIELEPDGSGRIVADPQPQSLTSQAPTILTPVSQVTEPIRKSFLATALSHPSLNSGEDFKVAFRADNLDYIGGLKRVTQEDGPRWVIGVIAPQQDFFANRRATVLFLVAVAAVALAIGSVVAILLARRFARPLQEIVRETVKIRSLELGESKVTHTNIREIDALSESIEAMKSGLRSMEKLVPTEYARHLIASGQEATLGGVRRHITTFFGDIVGFTRLSHQLPPEELIIVLSEYLDVLSQEVINNDGTLDKFNGDDVMAFWGAPTITEDHAIKAVSAALSSIKKLEEMHKEWRDQNRPSLSASFGIATGDVIVGNVGSKSRMNYTVIGDSVNLASRLQGLNKFYKTNILIGSITAGECQDKFLLRRVDRVFVFGRDEAVTILEPLCHTSEATDEQIAFVKKCELAFDAYVSRDWELAAQRFEDVIDEVDNDGPSRILHARCLEFIAKPPPENWNGAYELLHK